METKNLRQLIITIDHLPYRELNPNSREHYMVKARAVKLSREEIGWLAKSQWHDSKPMEKARISFEFHVKDKRRHDLDNFLAMTKPWIDGLIDVDVLLSDDFEHLEIGSIVAKHGDKDYSVIKVEELK